MFNGNDDNKDTQTTISINSDLNSRSRITNQIDGYTRNKQGEFTQETNVKNLQQEPSTKSFSFNFEMPITINPKIIGLGGFFPNSAPTPYATNKILEEMEISDKSIHDYDVKIGDIKLQYDSESGLSIAAGTKAIEKKISYDMPLIDIAEKIPGSHDILNTLKNKLIEEGYDPKSTVLKEITILGPGVELSGNFGKKGVGFETGAKVAGIKLKFSQQINSEKAAFIECTFNAGAKFGKNIDSHTTKNNKQGHSKETHIAMGSWEVSVGIERNNETKSLISSIAPIDWKNSKSKIKKPETRSEHFLQSHGQHPEVLTKEQRQQLETLLKKHELAVNQQLQQAKEARLEQTKAEIFKETIETGQNTLKSIALIGEKCGVPALSKIADFGQSLMSLNSVLASNFKMNIPFVGGLAQGLALLNPITSMISIGLQIASLFGFGRKKQNDGLGKALKQMSEQLVAIQKGLIVIQEGLIAINTNVNYLRQEMQEYFKHSFGNQQIILQSIVNLSRTMVEDFKVPVMNALYDIQGEISRLQIDDHQDHIALNLFPLEKLSTEIELFVDPEFSNQFTQEKKFEMLSNYTISLYQWIFKESSNKFFTEKNYSESKNEGNIYKWEKSFLLRHFSAEKISSITPFLVDKIENLTKKTLPETIDKSQLMNLMIWQTAVGNYFELINYYSDKLNKNITLKWIKKIEEQAENYLNLLGHIAGNTELFEALKKEYQRLHDQINSFISDVFYKIRSDKNTVVPQGKQPLYALIPENTLLREQLNPILQQFDTINLLFNMFAYMGGLHEDNKQINALPTSTDILNQTFNFSDTHTNATAWSDNNGCANPVYYETIRSCQIQIEGALHVVLLMRTSQTIDFWAYNTENNIWRHLPQKNSISLVNVDNPNYYKTIRTEVINIKGQDHLVFMIRRTEGFHIYTYDPSMETWDLITNIGALADNSCGGLPQPFPCVLETIRTNVIMYKDAPTLLVMFNSTSGYMVYAVDLLNKSFQQMGDPISSWHRFINTNEDQTTDPNTHKTSFQYYTTIRTEVMTLEGVSYLLAMIRDENGFNVMQLDLRNQQWQSVGTTLPWSDVQGFFTRSLIEYSAPPMPLPSVSTPNHPTGVFSRGGILEHLAQGLQQPKPLPSVPTLNHPTMVFSGGGILGHLAFGLQQLHLNQNSQIQQPPVLHTRIIPVAKGDRVPQYYESVRTAVMTIDGVPHLIAAVRHSMGLQVNALNLKTQQWQTLGTGSDLNWTDNNGWKNDCYLDTFRLQVVRAGKKDILIALARHSQGIQINVCDPSSKSWRILNTGNEFKWTDNSGFNQHSFYHTLRVQAIAGTHGGHDLLFMCRNNKNVEVFRFKAVPELLPEESCQSIQHVIEKTILIKNGSSHNNFNSLNQMLIISKYQASLYFQCLNHTQEITDTDKNEIEFKPKKESSKNYFSFFKEENKTEKTSTENFSEFFHELTEKDKYTFNVKQDFNLKLITIKFTTDKDEMFESEEEVKNKLLLLGKSFRDVLIENNLFGKKILCQCGINIKTKTLELTQIDDKKWDFVCQVIQELKNKCEKKYGESNNKSVCVIF